MKIISLSLDNSVLDKGSILAKKTIEYGALVDKYYMIVPAPEDVNVILSDQVTIYGVKGFCRPLKLWKMYVLAKILRNKFCCEVITTQDVFELGLIGFLLQKKYGIAWNAQEHGDFFSRDYWKNESLLNYFRFFLGRYLITKASSIRVVSERIRQYLIDDLRIDKERIVVVPVMTDISLDSAPLRQDSAGTGFVFLSMGRFVAQKNLSLLINAFAKVYEKFPETRLRLIGRGKLEDKLKAQVAEMKLNEAVEFIPWVENVNDEYARADAYVLSSNYEGWGRVIVEAAYSRLPIIMTDVGCAGELIKNNESGLVVPVGDENALVIAMTRLIEEAQLRLKLQNCAYESLKNLPNKADTLRLYKESWEKAKVFCCS